MAWTTAADLFNAALYTNTTIGLEFSTSLSGDGKTLNFYEKTGAYHVSNNPDGWGAPNTAHTAPDYAYLRIIDPAGTTYYIGLKNTQSVPTISSGFPTNTTDNSVVKAITMADLGGAATDIFTDGIYTVSYIAGVNGSPNVMIPPKTRYVFLSHNVKCCVHKMFGTIKKSDCSCSNDKIDKALLAYTYYKAMLYSAICGQIDKTKEQLALVNRLCKGTGDCTNC